MGMVRMVQKQLPLHDRDFLTQLVHVGNKICLKISGACSFFNDLLCIINQLWSSLQFILHLLVLLWEQRRTVSTSSGRTKKWRWLWWSTLGKMQLLEASMVFSISVCTVEPPTRGTSHFVHSSYNNFSSQRSIKYMYFNFEAVFLILGGSIGWRIIISYIQCPQYKNWVQVYSYSCFFEWFWLAIYSC